MTLAMGLVAAALLIGANAFFVAAEFALVAVDRTKLEILVERDSRGAVTALELLRHVSYNLSGAQLGITITSLALGLLTEPVFASALESHVGGLVGETSALAVSIVVTLAVTTMVQMVVGELVPKSVAVARPIETMLRLARAFRGFVVVFRPVIAVCNSTANALVRLVGIEPTEELSTVRSREELRRLVHTSAEGGTLRSQTADLLDRTFRFGDKTVADALTPRPDIVALDVGATVGDLLDLSAETGLSRFPLHEGDLDEVTGVVHVKDVLRLDRSTRRATALAQLAHPVPMVPESKLLDDLLEEFADGGAHLALVLDEYGGTAGIVTIEDLVEEIVGDIADEHDLERGRPRVRRWRGAHLLSGRLHTDEVREACGFEMPEGDYDTLAGFVLDQLGCIPDAGDGFESAGWTFEVTEMEDRRVATVRVVAPSPGVDVIGTVP